MRAKSKGHVTIVLATDVQPIRIRKAFWISIGRTHHRDHSLPLADLPAADLEIFRRQASGMLAWTLVAQQFFDGRWNQREITCGGLRPPPDCGAE